MRTKKKAVLAWVLSLAIAVTFMPIAGGSAYASTQPQKQKVNGITIEAVGGADEENVIDSATINKIAQGGDLDVSVVESAVEKSGIEVIDDTDVMDENGVVSLQDPALYGEDAGAVEQSKAVNVPEPTTAKTLKPQDCVTGQEGERGGLPDEDTITLNVTNPNSSGIVTVTGEVTGGDKFEGLYVDDKKVEWLYESSFYETIDMKDYEVGFHEIRVVTENGAWKAVDSVPTFIYSYKPSLSLSSFYTTSSCMTVYTGSDYYYDSSCSIYMDIRQGNGKWVQGYGPMKSYSSYKRTGLKPGTKYSVRLYYAKPVEYGGTIYLISGKDKGLISPTCTVKTGTKKPPVKKISISNVKQKSQKYRINYFFNGIYQYSRTYRVWWTKFTCKVKMKKKPNAAGIYIGTVKRGGNKKTYKATFTLSGKKKGKRLKFSVISYQSSTYRGYSDVYYKKVKIK